MARHRRGRRGPGAQHGAGRHLLQPADRAALLTFSADVRLRSGWSADRRQLQAAVERCEAAGATSLHDAAYAALTQRDARPGRTLVLVFSDGDDTSSWLPGANALDVARRNDGVVYAVTLESSETYSPRGVEKGGWHPIDVRLKNRPGKITARKGYLR